MTRTIDKIKEVQEVNNLKPFDGDQFSRVWSLGTKIDNLLFDFRILDSTIQGMKQAYSSFSDEFVSRMDTKETVLDVLDTLRDKINEMVELRNKEIYGEE